MLLIQYFFHSSRVWNISNLPLRSLNHEIYGMKLFFLFWFLSCENIIQQEQALLSRGKNITLTFSFFIALIDLFAWSIDALSSVTIHSDIVLIFTKVIAYT